MIYTCPTCGKAIDRDLLVFIGHTEDHIVEEIRKMHPDWKGDDGICAKCLEYYRNQIRPGR